MKRIPGLQYDSPYTFSTKQKLALAVLPPVLAFSLMALVATCRKEERGTVPWEVLLERHSRVIMAFWHESTGLAACRYPHKGWHSLTSYSYDGEFAARVVRWFGSRAVRGSSSRGGSEALASMAAALEHVPVLGFTIDGPRGPRRVAKPGVAILAARTRTPIVPHAFAVGPAWHLHSWDHFPIPKPFARIVHACGPPIPPPADESPEAIEATRLAVETELNRLHASIESPR